MKTHIIRYLFILCSLMTCLLIACSSAPTPFSLTHARIVASATTTPNDESPPAFLGLTASPDLQVSPSVQGIEINSALAHLGMPWADFSLEYDPSQWDISGYREDMPQLEMLTHHSLDYCRITPNIPVGLGDGWTTKESQNTFGELTLQTKYFLEQGNLKFVAYYGFLGSFYEGGVEVHFKDSAEACIQVAEELFSTTEVVLP